MEDSKEKMYQDWPSFDNGEYSPQLIEYKPIWEYSFLDFKTTTADTPMEIVKQFNVIGAEGYELVQIDTLEVGRFYLKQRAVFKRIKE